MDEMPDIMVGCVGSWVGEGETTGTALNDAGKPGIGIGPLARTGPHGPASHMNKTMIATHFFRRLTEQ